MSKEKKEKTPLTDAQKQDRKKKIAGALNYASSTLKGIATANAGFQSTDDTPQVERKQRPIDIDPFGQDNHANA